MIASFKRMGLVDGRDFSAEAALREDLVMAVLGGFDHSLPG